LADRVHVKLLTAGVAKWNEWRKQEPHIAPDLSGAELRKHYLREFNLANVDLSNADLRDVSFRRTNLSNTNLSGTRLHRTYFGGARLDKADFSCAVLYETIFANVNLSKCLGLDSVHHRGPSTLDYRTIARSKSLSHEFLRGCGLPDTLIDTAFASGAIEQKYWSSFISYSSKDDIFVRKLHADLQQHDVRCWFAPKDMKFGAKIRDTIDEAIREQEKVILVLSANTIASAWVEKEFETTFGEEHRRNQTILLPIRIDASPLKASKSWIADIKRTRNIGDFSGWRDNLSYQQALAQLLNALVK